MNIDNLKTFVVVCEAGSLSAAAARLDVPVSTVSRRLSKLEEDIGQPLFERTGRGIRLSERADRFAGVVRDTLRELEEGVGRFCDGGGRPLSRLRISAPVEVALSLLPEALLRVRRAQPELSFEVSSDRRRVAVLEENYDLAIRLGEQMPEELIALPLGKVSLRLMAAPAYLHGRPPPVHPRELRDHESILVTGLPVQLAFAAGGGERVTGAMRGSVQVSTFTEAARLAGMGAGIALLPSYTAAVQARPLGLRPILARWAMPEVAITALYPQRNRGAPAISLICEHIAAVLRQADAAVTRWCEDLVGNGDG